MNIKLNGKNALVCGSSKGIGKACAIELSKLGANVTLVARSTDRLSETIKELHRVHPQDHDFLVADFSEPIDLKKKVKILVGAKPIHILVNNTGGPPPGPILEADDKSFLLAIQQHLICNHLLAQVVSKAMKKEKFGRIINIISTSVKAPIENLGVSNTTRAAVANWAKTLANELGPYGITVNNVLPGATKTERLNEIILKKSMETSASKEEVEANFIQSIPLGRFGEAHEIAAAVAFLASPAAAYITGTNVTVDGGRTASL